MKAAAVTLLIVASGSQSILQMARPWVIDLPASMRSIGSP
jgi:hypothetical protein